MTLSEFTSTYKIGFYQEWVRNRPDNLMQDQPMNHYKCRITRGKRGFTLYFSQGLGCSNPPTLEDVLSCLASDGGTYENASSFEDWASDYGYDTDSRKVEKTFKAVKRQAEQLRRTLGDAVYQSLLWDTEQL